MFVLLVIETYVLFKYSDLFEIVVKKIDLCAPFKKVKLRAKKQKAKNRVGDTVSNLLISFRA